MQEDMRGRYKVVVRMEAVRLLSVALREKKRAPTSLTVVFADAKGPAFGYCLAR